MNADHQRVADVFSKFRAAVLAGDLAAFEALCVRDLGAQRAVFEKNASRVRDAKLDLKLQRIEQEGQVATVGFAVLDARGARVDEGELTMTEEPEGFRIRSL